MDLVRFYKDIIEASWRQKNWIGGKSQESNLPGTAGGPIWIWSPAAPPGAMTFHLVG